jgi:hypothetical protein
LSFKIIVFSGNDQLKHNSFLLVLALIRKLFLQSKLAATAAFLKQQCGTSEVSFSALAEMRLYLQAINRKLTP